MPEFVYFDTDAFHRVATTLNSAVLPDDLRTKIQLSPITALEVITKLTLKKADKMLEQIRAMRGWLPLEGAVLMDWPHSVLSDAAFGVNAANGFPALLGDFLNSCLTAESADKLREPAGKIKDLLDRQKNEAAEQFVRLAEAWKREPLNAAQHRKIWVNFHAQMAGVASYTRRVDDIISSLSAYFEYDNSKLDLAVNDPKYNPCKKEHKNDFLDVKQLVYLAYPNRHFLTCDHGFETFVKTSPQRTRIHRVCQDSLTDKDAVVRLLTSITS
jgi:hypothetical protein